MSAGRICAVIPAAGRGSRLGLDVPKILAPMGAGRTVWSILRDKLMTHAGRVHVVISPAYRGRLEEAVAGDARRERISLSVQPEPRGMGDALMGCAEAWRGYDTLLVIWGDQVHVSAETLRRTMEAHGAHRGARCTLPLVEMRKPYVQYVFGDGGSLMAIRETREGDATDEVGLADSGVFVLEVEGLERAWREYVGTAQPGGATGELNFLPFLVYLSRVKGWRFHGVRIEDADEARGINTPADLAYFREYYRRMDEGVGVG